MKESLIGMIALLIYVLSMIVFALTKNSKSNISNNIMELNKKVIFGTIVRKDGNEVELKDCRRIWYWNGAASLSELALSGVKREGSKFSVTVESIVILGVIEIIPCTEEAIKNIESVPGWKAKA